jgi:hypothetical protein
LKLVRIITELLGKLNTHVDKRKSLSVLTHSMQFSIPGVTNATAEANRANAYPDIRIFSVGQGTQSNTPLVKLGSIQEEWAVANNMTIAFDSNNAFGYFSVRVVEDQLILWVLLGECG